VANRRRNLVPAAWHCDSFGAQGCESDRATWREKLIAYGLTSANTSTFASYITLGQPGNLGPKFNCLSSRSTSAAFLSSASFSFASVARGQQRWSPAAPTTMMRKASVPVPANLPTYSLLPLALLVLPLVVCVIVPVNVNSQLRLR